MMLAALFAASAQSSGPLVELSLIVTDKANNSVTTLRKEEVRVFEDNVEQAVLTVERDESPIDIGIAIDASGSFRSFLPQVLEQVNLIVTSLRPDDQIFIEKFVSSDKIQRFHDFTTDRNALLESLKLFQWEGGQSAVVDALYTAVRYVGDHNHGVPARRKAVVIITDGEDRNSQIKADALIKLLREQKVQVFVLGSVINLDEENQFRKSPRERAEQLLRSVAEESGGRVFFFRSNKELSKATVQLVADLKGQFRLTYQSTNNNPNKTFRKVEVKLISPQGEKRTAFTRRGYDLRSQGQIQPGGGKTP